MHKKVCSGHLIVMCNLKKTDNMRQIELNFNSVEDRDTLLADKKFARDMAYLNPLPTESNRLILTDPVEEHSSLDTEVVVLTMFARAFKRIMFPTTPHEIEFLSPTANQSKIGIRHDTRILISNNQIQL